jgi:hypothetical protein
VVELGGLEVFTSGWITSTALTYTMPPDVLDTDLTYEIYVIVRDTGGVEGSDSVTVDTDWVKPGTVDFAVYAGDFDTEGHVVIHWSAIGRDAEFAAYRIYYRLVGATAWTLLATYDHIAPSYEHLEYKIGATEEYEYVVVQVADRFGALVEGPYNPLTMAAESSNYFLIVELEGEVLAVPLYNVIGDDPVEEQDYELHQIIGRGRVEDRGTRWGWTGSLVCQLRDKEGGLTARLQRQQILAAKAIVAPTYLRNPFGDVWLVSLGNASISRIAGVGTREFVDLTLPYSELS